MKRQKIVIEKAVLHCVSGKLGAGKTTLARKISDNYNAVFISEDIWLTRLYPEEINDITEYLRYSKRLRHMLESHVTDLLGRGISVIFDFAGNVPAERAWVKSIADSAQAECILHYIEASDDLCRLQFKKRNLDLPEGSKFVTDEEFNAINKYFVTPSEEEDIKIQRH